jgi:hypothetical protein
MINTSKNNLWTDEEIEKIRANLDKPISEIARMFRKRSYHAVKQFITYHGGKQNFMQPCGYPGDDYSMLFEPEPFVNHHPIPKGYRPAKPVHTMPIDLVMSIEIRKAMMGTYRRAK